MAVKTVKSTEVFCNDNTPVSHVPPPSISSYLREGGENNKGQPHILGVHNATDVKIQNFLDITDKGSVVSS